MATRLGLLGLPNRLGNPGMASSLGNLVGDSNPGMASSLGHPGMAGNLGVAANRLGNVALAGSLGSLQSVDSRRKSPVMAGSPVMPRRRVVPAGSNGKYRIPEVAILE